MKKTIITVVGKDTVGIIAAVCSYLADNKVNILDISQTIVQEYFNMMMIVDCNNASKPVHELSDDLEKIGDEIGVVIKMQHEDIFNSMHRNLVNGRKNMINKFEVIETNKMIDDYNLDVRTITLGISLMDCISNDLETLNNNIIIKLKTCR